MVVDLRRINAILKSLIVALPKIDELLADLVKMAQSTYPALICTKAIGLSNYILKPAITRLSPTLKQV